GCVGKNWGHARRAKCTRRNEQTDKTRSDREYRDRAGGFGEVTVSLVIPSKVEESLTVEMVGDVSTSRDMTKIALIQMRCGAAPAFITTPRQSSTRTEGFLANIARCTSRMIRCITKNFILRRATSGFRRGRRSAAKLACAFAGTNGIQKQRASLRCTAQKLFFT